MNENDPFIVFSENLVGLDFLRLWQRSGLLQLMRLTEEMGLYEKEFANLPQ